MIDWTFPATTSQKPFLQAETQKPGRFALIIFDTGAYKIFREHSTTRKKIWEWKELADQYMKGHIKWRLYIGGPEMAPKPAAQLAVSRLIHNWTSVNEVFGTI